MQTNKTHTGLWMDLGLVAFLIGLDVVARLVPHAPGFMPIAASALPGAGEPKVASSARNPIQAAP